MKFAIPQTHFSEEKCFSISNTEQKLGEMADARRKSFIYKKDWLERVKFPCCHRDEPLGRAIEITRQQRPIVIFGVWNHDNTLAQNTLSHRQTSH